MHDHRGIPLRPGEYAPKGLSPRLPGLPSRQNLLHSAIGGPGLPARAVGVSMFRADTQAYDPGRSFGFLLLPNFSLGAFSAAVEVLRLANHSSGCQHYDWATISVDGGPVMASNGVEVAAQWSIGDAGPCSTVILCSGINIESWTDKQVYAWLRKTERRGTNIGAMCTGSHVLARLGLLDGYCCTVHWENLPGFAEEFPEIDVRDDIYVIDRNRFTCAGGFAAADMMLSFVIRRHGDDLAAAISEELLYERIRDDGVRQRMALRRRLAAGQPKLLETITRMAEHIEQPVSQQDLAREAALSIRQLERLFQKYLGCTPSRYYLDMRLNHARALLQQTSMSVMAVALATGFVSASHFSKCYRHHFGRAPREEKRARAA